MVTFEPVVSVRCCNTMDDSGLWRVKLLPALGVAPHEAHTAEG